MLKRYFENVGTQHYHFLLRRWWPAAGQGSGPAAWSRQRAGAAAAGRREVERIVSAAASMDKKRGYFPAVLPTAEPSKLGVVFERFG